MNGERGEDPALNTVIIQHLQVADVVLVGLWFALDDDAEHIKDGIAMAVERRALQRIAIGHTVVLPLLIQLLERQSLIGPELIDDPDILVKYLSWFHDCKTVRRVNTAL